MNITMKILLMLLTSAMLAAAAAENIVFPEAAGVVDVTKPPYNAVGDSVTDATDAIQKAFDDYPAKGAIIYLPNGVYRISKQIHWPFSPNEYGWHMKNTILQGQSQEKTVLMLKDACNGFTDTANPKAMIWTGDNPAQRFRNSIRNMTISTGTGNPGAIGVQFNSSNQGCMRMVTIKDGDGTGQIGLDMSFIKEIGPLLIKNVTVDGFNYGITNKWVMSSQAFHSIKLSNQRIAGIKNCGQTISFHNLESDNEVTVLDNACDSGFVTIVDAELRGKGNASGKPAMINKGTLMLRNVKTPGYSKAVQNDAGTKTDVSGTTVDEFVSHEVLELFPSSKRTLNLPIKETPDVPWDPPEDWFVVPNPDDGDDSKAIQDAIDGGHTTVCFARGSYKISKTIFIRGKVRRLIGCEAAVNVDAAKLRPHPAWVVTDEGTAPIVKLERIARWDFQHIDTFMVNASSRTLVLSSVTGSTGKVVCRGSGDVFIEDYVGHPLIVYPGVNVWARQLDIENQPEYGPNMVNNGGNLWVFGYKKEINASVLHAKGGGASELFGIFCYTHNAHNSGEITKKTPMFIIEDSDVSLNVSEIHLYDYDNNGNLWQAVPCSIIVVETQKGVTKTFVRGQVPLHKNGSMLPLYTSNDPSAAFRPAPLHVMPLPESKEQVRLGLSLSPVSTRINDRHIIRVYDLRGRSFPDVMSAKQKAKRADGIIINMALP